MSPLLLAAIAFRGGQAPPAVDPTALANLVARCKESQSWGLVVMKDGKVVCDENFGKAKYCNMMSATKSVTSMAIGALLTDGVLKSVDVPVASILPSFKGGKRELVTVRQMLEHSSGLALYTEQEGFPINRVAGALKARVVTEPGKVFQYNNRAVDLLSGVIRKLAGKPEDLYVFERIFQPLGMTPGDFEWSCDPDGNPHGCAELYLRPRCMATLGQLMMQKGVWEGKRILSEEYVNRATHASEISRSYNFACGWLWWVSEPHVWFDAPDFDKFKRLARFDQTQQDGLKKLVGAWYTSYEALVMDGIQAVGGLKKWQKGWSFDDEIPYSRRPLLNTDWDGYYANGWGGQYILVLPSRGLVVVRTGGEGFFDTDDPVKYEMPDLYRLAVALVPKPKG